MKYRIKLLLNILFFATISQTACEKIDKDSLSVSTQKIEIQAEGGIAKFSLETNATSWSIETTNSEWLMLSTNSGTHSEALISILVETKTLQPRTATLTVKAGKAEPIIITVSQKTSTYLYDLKTNINSLFANSLINNFEFTVTTNAPEWKIVSDANWLQLNKTIGTAGETTLNLTVLRNTNATERKAKLTLNANFAPSVELSITQAGGFQNYNTNPLPPDNTGMGSTANELAGKIITGWNIGNTLEAIGGETAWGNPKITAEYVKFVKQCGFNAIRLPASWNQYANQNTAEINAAWLNRVKEVVQYCVDNDMYVLLNIHWDGGWLENNCTSAKQEANIAKQHAFWEQIATHMRDFDEHLLFASANEPNVKDAAQMTVLTNYHQTFIDAVRSTGGKNAYRVLVVQGPSTDIKLTNELMNTLPTDNVPNKLMAEIHYYSPWNFCGMTEDANWGNMFYYWGKDNHSTTDTKHNPTWGEEADVDKDLVLIKTKFQNKGIPIIMGEYGAISRTNLTGEALALHKKSRAYYFEYVTRKAKANGILPFFWDTGGILDRKNNVVIDQQSLDALINGAKN